jgi:hypothetical protein
VRVTAISQRGLILSPWIIASDIDGVRDWRDELEERAARHALNERDLKRLGKVVKRKAERSAATLQVAP